MTAIRLLRTLGEQIRAKRVALRLTQRQLGERAGIVDKYVSEIERGTRDVPLSTLYAVVERGLDLRLDIAFRERRAPDNSVAPSRLEDLWSRLSTLPNEAQASITEILRRILELMR